MKTFNEKCDRVLKCLALQPALTWNIFQVETGIHKADAIIAFLAKKEFIHYTEDTVHLTNLGQEFISLTSFVDQRDQQAVTIGQLPIFLKP